MDLWGNRVVLVAVGDGTRRRTYRTWIESEYEIWTAADRLEIYERVSSAVDVVLVGPDLLGRDGLSADTFRGGTDGCRVVLVGRSETDADPDEVLPDPDPQSLAATTERLVTETTCERLLADAWRLAETKAGLERELGDHTREAVAEYRTARDRFHELSRRLDEVLDGTEFDWPSLFDKHAADEGIPETGSAVE